MSRLATTDTMTASPVPLEARDAVAVGRMADALRQVALTEDGPCKLVTDMEVPVTVLRMICDLLDDLAEGRAVTIAPSDLPVGTEAAANLLGVSRPWLTTLVDRGELAGERVGSKRRVRLGDLVAFRRADDARRRAVAEDWSFLDEPAD